MSSPVQAIVFDPEHRHWLHFQSPRQVFTTTSVDEVVSLLERVEQCCSTDNVWAVGWISYEAAPAFDHSLHTHQDSTFPKVWFATFSNPTILKELPRTIEPAPLSWIPSVSEQHYTEAIQSIRSAISAGDTYQTNYTFRLRSNEAPSALPLFSAMTRAQGGDYGCLIETGEISIASASPELFFTKNGSAITCRPMKGTSTRGRTLEEDLAYTEQLRTSEKNRAENIMIVDMTRNDLSRIAERGSVRISNVCAIEKYPHMFQMTSEVTATSNASVVKVIKALFPAASITGAPKTETMKIISELESTPRKIYTGSIGVISPNDRAWFNVAIRTAIIDYTNKTTEYGIGSGIVWDSASGPEYQECLAKAAAVTQPTPQCELFETILWEAGHGYFLLEEHLTRIARGADYAGWPFDRARAEQALKEIERDHDTIQQARRIRLFAAQNGTIRTDSAVIAALPHPYRIAVATYPINSSDRSLFRKTTDRRVYDQAIPFVPDAHDIILWNERGEITETRIANICLEIDGRLLTPRLESGLLAGCYRELLLKTGRISEATLTLHDLKRASRIVLINSLRREWDAELCVTEAVASIRA